jgi:type IV secretory pathway VirB10-like protein
MGSVRRDRLVRSVRVTRWTVGIGAAGLTAAFSVAAAHAFKGHDGQTTATTAPPHARVTVPRVPRPDNVPSIADDGSLQPPAQAPQTAPPAQQQEAPAQPPVSGGS